MDSEVLRRRSEATFQSAGLLYETGTDQPGRIYTSHQHGWVTLVTLGGSIRLTVDGAPHELKTGDVFEIKSNHLHEGVVGPDGWHWLAAWKPAEDHTFAAHDA